MTFLFQGESVICFLNRWHRRSYYVFSTDGTGALIIFAICWAKIIRAHRRSLLALMSLSVYTLKDISASQERLCHLLSNNYKSACAICWENIILHSHPEIEISFKFIPKILMSKERIHFLGHSVYSKLKYVDCTKYVCVQAWIRVCELSVYVVCVPGLFIKLIVIVMVMCYLYSY